MTKSGAPSPSGADPVAAPPPMCANPPTAAMGKKGPMPPSPFRMDPAASPPPTRTDLPVVSSDDDGSDSGFKRRRCRRLLNSSVGVSGQREIEFWVFFCDFSFSQSNGLYIHMPKSDLHKRLLYPHEKSDFHIYFGAQP